MPMFNNFSARIAKMMYTTKPKSDSEKISNKNRKNRVKSNQMINKKMFNSIF